MNLATLEITKEEAVERLREYEQMLTEERTVEDEAILIAYRAAKRGLPIIRLTEAFRLAGRFPDRNGEEGRGLPRLAIARADATQVHVRSDSGYGWRFTDTRDDRGRNGLVGRHHVRVHADGVTWQQGGGRTVVPTIPPRHRPNRRRIHLFHVLWEVESWTPEPPVDPALLRHIRGDLWSVAAVWDLTPVERAVLSQRSSPV
jgi:hypothetical protein